MCNLFPGLKLEHVKIIYTSPANGHGYVGRPQGPIPTVAVSIRVPGFTNGGLMGFGPRVFGPASNAPTTATGEAMNSGAQ